MRVGVDDEGADPLAARRLVDPEVREREVEARDVEEADPHLGAVDHVVVAVAPALVSMSETSVPERASVTPAPAKSRRARAASGSAASAPRSRSVRIELPTRPLGKVSAQADDVAVARDLLHQHRVGDVVEARAAVLRRDDPAREPELARLPATISRGNRSSRSYSATCGAISARRSSARAAAAPPAPRPTEVHGAIIGSAHLKSANRLVETRAWPKRFIVGLGETPHAPRRDDVNTTELA